MPWTLCPWVFGLSVQKLFQLFDQDVMKPTHTAICRNVSIPRWINRYIVVDIYFNWQFCTNLPFFRSINLYCHDNWFIGNSFYFQFQGLYSFCNNHCILLWKSKMRAWTYIFIYTSNFVNFHLLDPKLEMILVKPQTHLHTYKLTYRRTHP